ncbi:MAG: T9SS type A sorting domain-containing protein [Saprospiraceae bacterium]|nr:T9SS type A sorting domain-containing protein [Saprospiraceae bacterium]
MLRRLQILLFTFTFAVALSTNATAGETLYVGDSFFEQADKDVNLRAEIDGSRINLSWDFKADLEEIIVERSENGGSYTEVNALPNDITSFTDYIRNADLDDRALYYRLRLITVDGTEIISESVKVDLKSARNLKPNILVRNGQLDVEFYSRIPATTQVTIINNTGRPVRTFSIRAESGTNSEYIDAADLRSGLYFLRLEQQGEVTTTKFFIR